MQKRYFAVTAADRFGNESAPLALNEAAEMDMPVLNRGNSLYLPQNADAEKVVITTVTGEEILRDNYRTTLTIERLPAGFYVVNAVSKAGKTEYLGNIVK